MSLSVERAIQPKRSSSSLDGGGGSADRSAGERGEDEADDRWSTLLPDLLADIMRRVEKSEDSWPSRKSVVACACVCKCWREIAVGLVRPLIETGLLTFPSSLKQPGPRDSPMQCYIKRDKKNSTFYLYLSLGQTASADIGKFLLAARRTRRSGHLEYIISLDADDISQKSVAYIGKLRSDFLGTKFSFYDSQPPYLGAKSSSRRSTRRFADNHISPQVPAGNFKFGHLSYKFNLFKSRGPRRMNCDLQLPRGQHAEDLPESKTPCEPAAPPPSLTLRNKSPRWHEHLQCWCLNFHGRVTVASVKNFQLAAAPMDPAEPADEVTVLQFGKVGDDMFAMDYRQPLSAFQAFAICLTSFGTKFACE